MNRPLTKLEQLLLGALALLTCATVFLGSRALTLYDALSLVSQNRVIMAVPATARTNFANLDAQHETNH